jgi:hypothetical protein
MGYRIRVVPEVEVWLQQLRDSDPSAADLVDDALDTLREAGAGLGPPAVVPVEIPAQETPPLSELRPGAPDSTDIRILFTVDRAEDHPDTALLLAAGTERDWLRAWYTEMLLHCRTRYERDQGSTG